MSRKIKFKYIFDDDYNPIYINGAQGGLNSHGEIIANFYLERVGLPKSQTHEITVNGQIGNIIESVPEDLLQSHVRVIKNGVIMNLQTAIGIHEWLGKHIEALKAMTSQDAGK